MNNSFDRMLEGLVSTLRQEVIPKVGTEFARGQAFGVIYMLKSLQLRASWSSEFVGEQIAAQLDLAKALGPLLSSRDAPALPRAPDAAVISIAALEALRDENDARICDLIDWQGRASLDDRHWQAIESQIRAYMDRQLKHELKTSARPMFAEMSSGQE